MTWKKESQRHSLSRKHIKTTFKQYIQSKQDWYDSMIGKRDILDITEIKNLEPDFTGGYDQVIDMVRHLNKGGTLPPIEVSPFKYLENGRHRLMAYRIAGITQIPVIYSRGAGKMSWNMDTMRKQWKSDTQ